MTASGCGAMVLEYAHALRDDPLYRLKAERISGMTRDLALVLEAERAGLDHLYKAGGKVGSEALRKVAFHSPCTLQHGQKIRGIVETLISGAGLGLATVADAHLCCGSAGTYSVLQPELSKELRDRKLKALQGESPETIVTANIGCLGHLQSGTATPVLHWIELLDRRIAS